MKKNTNSLMFQIPVRIIGIILVVMLVIGLALNILLNNIISANVKTEIHYIAGHNAEVAQSYLENMQTSSKSLALEINRYKGLDRKSAEIMLKDSLTDILKDERIFSTYFAFEPNKYFPDTPGGLSYYAFRDGSDIKMDILNDYATYSSGDYYAPVKQSLSANITEPYSYELSTGETVWLVTISNPILDNSGKFIGIASCDILSSTISGLEYDLAGFDKAYTSIVTSEGNYIAHSADESKLGTNYMDSASADSEIFDAVQNGKDLFKEVGSSAPGGNKSILVCYPIKINGVKEAWSSAFVVNKAESLAPVRYVTAVVFIIALLGVILLAIFSFLILRKSLSPLNKVIVMAKRMGDGQLDIKNDNDALRNDELGELMGIFQETSHKLHEYISDISHTLDNVASGNLQLQVEREYIGDFQAIKDSLNHIITSLNDTLGEMQDASKQVSVSSDHVSYASQSLAQGATEQASSIEELSATIDDISDKVKHNAQNAANVSKQATDMGIEMENSNLQMQKMMEAMNAIDSKSNEISMIVKTIEDITFQTNILALNAAVEAARAGSAGRGFAVVADEVRNLAGKSSEAAKSIAVLIESSVSLIKDGSFMAVNTADSVAKVVGESKMIVSSIDNISELLQKEAAAIAQITVGMDQISAVVQTNSATAEESAAASEELFGQSQLLDSLIDKFKLTKN
ncbi:MAG: methyl-accepting chemotaxis protein [Proteocatella sp.]